MAKKKKQLDPQHLGLSGGIIWGGSVFLATWVSIATGYGEKFLYLLSNLYPGYEITALGSIIGLFLGFIDGFIALLLFGILHNWLNNKNGKNSGKRRN